ncbi:beta-ketoacyl-ACP synthase II [Candidatus Sumerlaeota bacterium]|nr:beta-ketoacyl-ACP synthase II [Candidatus Sumerlaeota bacterium]
MSGLKRVVVTGMGVVTPLGTGLMKFWENAANGVSGIVKNEVFDVTNYQSKVVGQVRDFNAEDHFDRKEIKRMDTFVRYGIVAAREAMKDSGLDLDQEDRDNIGCLIGSGTGGITIVEDEQTKLLQRGNRAVSPLLIPKMICNMASGMVAIDLQVKGPNFCIVTACAAGTHTLGEAAWLVRRGECEICVAGGAESTLTPLSIAGFANMKALTNNDDPKTACRPFDLNRDGFIMSEGAGVMILEELEHAKKRGARIYAEIPGYGASGDAYHMTAPAEGGEGGARALKKCLDWSGLNPEDVQYINAHGTSTPLNDKLETQAIKTVLGDYAYKCPVTSSKSMTGHMIGAGGAVEAILSVLTINHGVITPTINYETPDPECDLDYVPNVAREARVDVAVSNSLGFGGHNCSIALKRFAG